MITLWGVWDDNVNDWVAGAWTSDAELAERRAKRWGGAYQALPASFARVPPEVIEAAKSVGAGPVMVMRPHQEAVHKILNWIAQVVATKENEN